MLSIAICDDEVIDIFMQDLDGMKTAQIFRKQAFDKILIFISSSREYVFEAYDVEAFQYLLKPVNDRKLKSVLQKAVFKTERRSREFIIVSRERQKRKLFLDDIYYFEIKGRVVDAHGPEGIFTYYERIGELEALENGEKIVIAKRRYDGFVREMLAVMRKNGGII